MILKVKQSSLPSIEYLDLLDSGGDYLVCTVSLPSLVAIPNGGFCPA